MTPEALAERIHAEAEKAPPLTPDAIDLLRRLDFPVRKGAAASDRACGGATGAAAPEQSAGAA